MPMNKRTITEIIVGIIILIIGWAIGNKWQIATFNVDLQINIVDALTLVVTIVMGIYIAWIIEKEVQDKRIEKDMYLSKVCALEEIRDEIENLFQSNNGEQIDFKKIVSLDHRIRTKRKSIFKHLLDCSHGKIKKELENYDKNLKNDLKDLRNLLTQTSVGEVVIKDIEISNNIANYSSERTSLILKILDEIDNKFLEVKVLVNKI